MSRGGKRTVSWSQCSPRGKAPEMQAQGLKKGRLRIVPRDSHFLGPPPLPFQRGLGPPAGRRLAMSLLLHQAQAELPPFRTQHEQAWLSGALGAPPEPRRATLGSLKQKNPTG